MKDRGDFTGNVTLVTTRSCFRHRIGFQMSPKDTGTIWNLEFNTQNSRGPPAPAGPKHTRQRILAETLATSSFIVHRDPRPYESVEQQLLSSTFVLLFYIIFILCLSTLHPLFISLAYTVLASFSELCWGTLRDSFLWAIVETNHFDLASKGRAAYFDISGPHPCSFYCACSTVLYQMVILV